MNLDQISAVAVRVFFYAAFALLALAVFEVASRGFGYTILRGREPGRLLEYAVILLIFVVAILLRQIRDRLART
jgi:hypothetical protein